MERNRALYGSDELPSRPARQPDHAAEIAALMRLAAAQTGPRASLLEEISQTALSLCSAGSAGMSLVESVGESVQFRWLAVAGLCAELRGKTTAWNECPCGITLQAGEPQLFVRP
jgi:hypothetical protein